MGNYFEGVIRRISSLSPLGIALLVIGGLTYGLLAFLKKGIDESKVFKFQLVSLLIVFVGTIICFL